MAYTVEDIPVGSIIYVSRGVYEHYGIYIGVGKVIHFSASSGAETNANEADIIETSLSFFWKDSDRICVLADLENKPLPAEEIVQRAKSKLGKCKGSYDLVHNNCEHFAYWCRYGEKKSVQVDNAINIADKVIGGIFDYFDDIRNDVKNLTSLL